jgi:superfamily II DNA or RNA helicase
VTEPILRDYQQEAERRIYEAWHAGARNVLLVLPTGAGKTVTFANIQRRMIAPSVAIAHRHELVSQISLALARYNVRHRIIGQPALIRSCVQLHGIELGTSFYNATASVAAAGVDTLMGRDPAKDPLFNQTRLWVCDEAHHLLVGNKWGRTVEMFPNAFGLGVTATPVRADGKGLGRHHDGVIDVMIIGPSMRDLINGGYLTEYRVFAPPNDLDLSDVNTSAGGDYSPEPLRKAVRRSHIHGDVVSHYMRIAAGKLGITFAVDVESAVELAAAYRQQGIPAEAISAKTPDNIRYKLLRMFASGELKQLVNVDLFGEGFDLPAIEVCSMARPTQSYALYIQQFGRALRLLNGKTHGIIIDHVGNVLLHGLPDAPRSFTLDRRDRRSKTAPGEGPIPLRSCLQCAGVYERSKVVCPYCGTPVVYAGRSSPDVVDGDLNELTPDVLARMRGEIARADALLIPVGAGPEVVGRKQREHRERMEAQTALRAQMALWGGARTARGISIAEAQREFFLRYDIDVASAQMLPRAEALALIERISK